MSTLKVPYDQNQTSTSAKSDTSSINQFRNDPLIYIQQHQSIIQLLESPRKPNYEEKKPIVLSLNATCELSWLHLVHAEIIAVTSAMRKNSRWSGMSVSGLNMGGLGISMGLRGGKGPVNEVGYRNQVM
jgi:hypothetical protein